ncbi:sigma-E factor negative regulatory protein [Candidatus Nitrosacidococcus tergens]|uniref:Anti sigma-E protein RseA, N-terminal domain n=1 Tax=Candidatus Nitrosacidococcus tergens TaxID=553981 RepID=A0A7G1QAC4_9GAMM|nr:sigma-E factor negative regulatory protein [Candidatus Nitrosacidococcus tergens]CAB1276600.1 Anti sigma-E protein RseA, N-terminal domain [Candidatus Nitrosacidococcus tergens]
MSNCINEQLSALMDGELPVEELDLVLLSFKNDNLVRNHWQHYHFIRDSMQRNLSNDPSLDLSIRISEALESEPTFFIPVQEDKQKYKQSTLFGKLNLKQISSLGLAVAASLSVITFGLHTLLNQSILLKTESIDLAAQSISNLNTSPTISVNNTRWTAPDPEVKQQLNTYLVNHTEYIDTSGILGYGRIVSYEDHQ